MPHQSDFLPLLSGLQILLASSETAPQVEQKYAGVSFGTVACFFLVIAVSSLFEDGCKRIQVIHLNICFY